MGTQRGGLTEPGKRERVDCPGCSVPWRDVARPQQPCRRGAGRINYWVPLPPLRSWAQPEARGWGFLLHRSKQVSLLGINRGGQKGRRSNWKAATVRAHTTLGCGIEPGLVTLNLRLLGLLGNVGPLIGTTASSLSPNSDSSSYSGEQFWTAFLQLQVGTMAALCSQH